MDTERADVIAGAGAGAGEWQSHLEQQLVTAATKDATEENRGRKEDAAGEGKNAVVKSVNVSLISSLLCIIFHTAISC